MRTLFEESFIVHFNDEEKKNALLFYLAKEELYNLSYVGSRTHNIIKTRTSHSVPDFSLKKNKNKL